LSQEQKNSGVVLAILGDLHFWIPAIALCIGIALLVFLH
jgi:hypothetical protein